MPFLHAHYRHFIGSTSAFQHRFSSLYVSTAYFRMRRPDAFPRSNNPIYYHIPVGAYAQLRDLGVQLGVYISAYERAKENGTEITNFDEGLLEFIESQRRDQGSSEQGKPSGALAKEFLAQASRLAACIAEKGTKWIGKIHVRLGPVKRGTRKDRQSI